MQNHSLNSIHFTCCRVLEEQPREDNVKPEPEEVEVQPDSSSTKWLLLLCKTNDEPKEDVKDDMFDVIDSGPAAIMYNAETDEYYSKEDTTVCVPRCSNYTDSGPEALDYVSSLMNEAHQINSDEGGRVDRDIVENMNGVGASYYEEEEEQLPFFLNLQE